MKQGFVICSHHKTWPFLLDCLESLCSGNLSSEIRFPPVFVILTDWSSYNPGAPGFLMCEYNVEVLHIKECWEVNAIKTAWEHTDLEEMFFLQDTTEVLDPVGLAKLAFIEHRGHPCPVNEPFQCYLGKYRRAGLDRIDWPTVKTKEDAVRQEWHFTRHYLDMDPAEPRVLFPEFREGGKLPTLLEKHGRINRVTENDYLRKYRGTWAENLQDRLHEIDVEGKV